LISKLRYVHPIVVNDDDLVFSVGPDETATDTDPEESTVLTVVYGHF
jgi:hypothetical protein